jgi:ABC-type Zn uptake system ZnuABC Zn-binding protein ZnuA
MNIPTEVIDLAAEATSNHNDGWSKNYYKKKLEKFKKELQEIQKYIESVLKE